MLQRMNQEFDRAEFCVVCKKEADGDRWFCHFYTDRSRDTFCSPACAEVFLHRPAPLSRVRRAGASSRAEVISVEW